MDTTDFDLRDAIDIDILMQRDAHFGGSFPLMIEYYQRGGKGIQEEFSLKRIEELAIFERSLEQNLSLLVLGDEERATVKKSLEEYRNLRLLLQKKDAISRYPQLIANLILAETEEAEEEILAITKEGHKIVPELMALLKNDEYYSPLFPGYGKAPYLAAKSLGLIGDKRAIITLFEHLREGDFFDEEILIKALKAIGSSSKEFLLKVVQKKPINEDNERAALVLAEYSFDESVAKIAFSLIQDPDFQKDTLLCGYLILACRGLKGTPLEKSFRELANNPSFKEFKNDFKVVLFDMNSN